MNVGWKTVPLQSLCNDFKQDIVDGPFGSELQRKDYITAGVPVLKIQNVHPFEIELKKMDYVSDEKYAELHRHSFRRGDIVMTKLGSPLGVSAVVDRMEEGVIVADLVRIRAQQIDTRYLCYHLNSSATSEYINSMQKGTTRPRVRLSVVRQLPIALPCPAEQRRIVAVLDEAFEAIATAKANAEKNLQNARELFEFALNCAIQGRLIPRESDAASVSDLLGQIEAARQLALSQGRAKVRKLDPVEADVGDRPKLPSGWRWVQLDSLTIGISDGVHKTPRYVAEGIPFVTVKNLTAGRGISFDTLNYVTREDHDDYIKRTNPEQGDILITKDGTIGVVRLIETDVEFSIFVSVALVKPAIRELGPYLAYALRATCVQSQIVPQGAALKHLYLVDLRRLQVPLPSLTEQSRIVGRLDELDSETQRLTGLYDNKIAALDELRKAMLRQAFNGELSVATPTFALEAVA